jgi:hypothetical protein
MTVGSAWRAHRARVAAVAAVAAVLVAGLAAVAVLGPGSRARPARGPTGAPPPAARGGDARRPAPPTPPAYPRLPRWAAAGAELDERAAATLRRGTHARATLASGLTAELVAARPRFPRGRTLELQLTLRDRDGAPVVGRADTTVLVVHEESTDPPRRGFTVESASRPGQYGIWIEQPDAPPGRYRIHAYVSETGEAMAPGEVRELHVTVEYGGPTLGPEALATWADDGLTVTFAVSSDAPGAAVVRAELRDAGGAVLGEARGAAPLVAGGNLVPVRFGPVVSENDPRGADLWLHGVTLFAGSGERFTDFWPEPRRLTRRAAGR